LAKGAGDAVTLHMDLTLARLILEGFFFFSEDAELIFERLGIRIISPNLAESEKH